ncbi:MAG: PBS lyase [Deltaproteobacteria bacterium RIFOXYD12_FULL_50_9]|nr:MAG: PBS lyase [Deltaproteobacteria bacterium RIFOXYD12_FULL_50_9]
MPKSEIHARPWCPFCSQIISKPREPDIRKIGEFSTGSCTNCGAVYTCDPTGFNVGAAMVDCLVHACNDNWELAWDLLPEIDYLTDQIDKYDEITNQVVDVGNLDGRAVRGVLFFVRMLGDFTKIAEKHGQPNSGFMIGPISGPSIAIEIEPARDPKRIKKKADKAVVQAMVESLDIDGLVDLALDDLKTIRFIQRLLFTPDTAIRWKTAFIFGKVCARLSTRKPGAVSDVLHRLFAACSDSASTNWGAIEAIGSIISERPDIFGTFTRYLFNYLGDRADLPATLWALGAIAKSRPDLIRKTPFYGLLDFLNDDDSLIRGLTLRIFGHVQAKEAKQTIKNLQNDNAILTIYEEGKPVSTTIAELATEAIRLIEH